MENLVLNSILQEEKEELVKMINEKTKIKNSIVLNCEENSYIYAEKIKELNNEIKEINEIIEIINKKTSGKINNKDIKKYNFYFLELEKNIEKAKKISI